jgi:hypothetical protein
MPRWLSSDYADARERLTAKMKKNPSGRPTCYDRHTFIDGTPYHFFVADHKFQPSPEDFYRPRYFVWLPHLFARRIPCPACLKSNRRTSDNDTIYLRQKGWPASPRHVVDLHECIYIIGYRYSCGNKECLKTYQSWSTSLLAALPHSLSANFTFHLTYRSGLSDQVVALMQASFQHGIGPGPFSEMIRTFHICKHEYLHQQYPEMVYIRLRSPAGRLLGKFQPFSLFNDQDGYAGFTPCANYFRQFYVKYIASHAAEMDQHMSMLSANVIQ